MDRFQYLIVMALCVLVTLPLEWVFDARVWRQPRRLALAVVPALLVFVAWDIAASTHGTWSFERRYTIGVTLPGGMAIEELVFFVVVPLCTLITLESVRNVLAGRTPAQRWWRDR